VNYCPTCGEVLSPVVRRESVRQHVTCPACHTTHFEKPTIQTSCIATVGNKVLWLKRATEPQKGCWALPSGFLEPGETPAVSAARELHEETGGSVDPKSLTLFLIGSLPEMNQIYLVYRGALADCSIKPTEEASEVALLCYDEVEFDNYAYPDVVEGIHLFYRDHQRGNYGVYMGEFESGRHTLRRITAESIE